ncbi:MAG: hypothetical protein JWN74_2086 [Acidobacteriaceae bacterium]|nr:hypothetical protein [Acidobacteriaceae bacterium]
MLNWKKLWIFAIVGGFASAVVFAAIEGVRHNDIIAVAQFPGWVVGAALDRGELAFEIVLVLVNTICYAVLFAGLILLVRAVKRPNGFVRALVVVLICALAWFGVRQYRSWITCKRRGEQFNQRAEQLERNAKNRLKVGTHKSDVAQFFAENGIPVTFDRIGYTTFAMGTIYTSGCGPVLVCGSDRALIGLRVEVDSEGSVKGKPEVVPMYTDCL